jgi:C4-dicarboxylate-specific signal transduction histidine kinase
VHAILLRQLRRGGLDASALPSDMEAWMAFLQAVNRAYELADHDRYLLERSLSLSSEEMGELHAQLAAERDTITTVICSLAEGVCALDCQGAILFINPEARRLLRLPVDDMLVGLKLDDLVKARTSDGHSLGDVLAKPPADSGREMKLVVDGNETTVITLSIAPLGLQREGLVMTLRDVTEQTKLETERSELNRRLLEVSRQAGMAEVASGVLHNVGNVLNSVNVSATITSDMIRETKAVAIAKLAELLKCNASRLGEFLTSDPAGRTIPEYVSQLATHLEDERRQVLGELAQLRKNIDHIREIVVTQQSYAKVAGVKEREQMSALVDDALRVTEAALVRHQITVTRDFEPSPDVLVERHQVLQIVINLITNAKQAMQPLAPAARRLTLRVRPGEGTVVLQVRDNGMGISSENLTRVFLHGFTTRRDGHGFGLHSAALAAKSLGGSIRADSDGSGHGATFTLEIPAEARCARMAA